MRSKEMHDSLLSRALRVINAASNAADGLRFSEIQALLGNISPTTVSKILRELQSGGVLEKSSDGRYRIGLMVAVWAKSAGARRGPLQIIREQMQRLFDSYEISVNVFTCSNGRMFCLESLMADEGPALWPSGKSLELQLAVIGAVFYYDDNMLRDESFLLAQCERHRPKLALEDVLLMIEGARRDHIQYDPGLFYPGTYRLAVSLVKKGSVAMVLGVGVLEAVQNGTNCVEQLRQELLAAKLRIETELNV